MNWDERKVFMLDKSACRHEWTSIAEMGTAHSARAQVVNNNLRHPEFLWTRAGRMIRAFFPASESIIEHARRKNKEGFEKYGDVWSGRDAATEAKDELADAFNYVQWARANGEITVWDEKELISDLMKVYNKVRLMTEAPKYNQSPKAYPFKVTNTIGKDRNG